MLLVLFDHEVMLLILFDYEMMMLLVYTLYKTVES